MHLISFVHNNCSSLRDWCPKRREREQVSKENNWVREAREGPEGRRALICSQHSLAPSPYAFDSCHAGYNCSDWEINIILNHYRLWNYWSQKLPGWKFIYKIGGNCPSGLWILCRIVVAFAAGRNPRPGVNSEESSRLFKDSLWSLSGWSAGSTSSGTSGASLKDGNSSSHSRYLSFVVQ